MTYKATTRNIEVVAIPHFMDDRSSPADNQYFWAYIIEIRNTGAETVRLQSRYWQITDQTGQMSEVRGEGVIGEQPLLGPGESFRYTSGVPLRTPSGMMMGRYTMTNAEGEIFDVKVPPFSLDSPYAQRRMN